VAGPRLVPFLAALEESGRVRVPASPDASLFAASGEEGPDDDLDARLRALAGRARADLAHDPPALHLPAARWALRTLFAACQAFAHRAIPPEAIERALAAPCPAPASPSVALSVDLLFSVLPDLASLTRGLGDDDALRAGLLRLAREWPLSSVGVSGVAPPLALDAFIDDPSLRALYVDRILRRRDLTRLGAPPVDAALREALGGHPELCAEVAAALVPAGEPS
jgi:hypothetical protein